MHGGEAMSILDILEEHKRLDAYEGPATCSCEEWESRRTGLNSSAQHRAHVAQVLEQHEREAKAEAVRESARYLNHIMPNGLVNPIAVLADLDVAAIRLGRGLHANGRDRSPS